MLILPKPVRLARSTSHGGMKIRGMDGAGEKVCSLIEEEQQWGTRRSLITYVVSL